MSSGMNVEQAKEYAGTMTYRQAISNVGSGKFIKYRKATMIKLRELAEIADRLDRKTEPQTEEEKVREVVRGFMNIVNDMRNPTEEEKESVNKYIESISKPTGVNVFELMDEPQTEREGE